MHKRNIYLLPLNHRMIVSHLISNKGLILTAVPAAFFNAVTFTDFGECWHQEKASPPLHWCFQFGIFLTLFFPVSLLLTLNNRSWHKVIDRLLQVYKFKGFRFVTVIEKKPEVESSLITNFTWFYCQTPIANPSTWGTGVFRSYGISKYRRRGADPDSFEVNGNFASVHPM